MFQDWHFVIELAPLVGSLEGPGRDRMDGDGNLITPTGKMHHTGQTVQDTELSSKFSTQSTYEKPWRWHAGMLWEVVRGEGCAMGVLAGEPVDNCWQF